MSIKCDLFFFFSKISIIKKINNKINKYIPITLIEVKIANDNETKTKFLLFFFFKKLNTKYIQNIKKLKNIKSLLL